MQAEWVGHAGVRCTVKQRAPDNGAQTQASVRATEITECQGEVAHRPLNATQTLPAVADSAEGAAPFSLLPGEEPSDSNDKEVDIEWIAQRLYGIPRLPGEDFSTATHMWSEAPHEQFRIRGRHYTTKGHKLKGKKGPSAKEGYALENVCLIPTGVLAAIHPSTPSAHSTAAVVRGKGRPYDGALRVASATFVGTS